MQECPAFRHLELEISSLERRFQLEELFRSVVVLEICFAVLLILFCVIFQTVLPASYADEISIFDFNMRPGASVWPRPDCTTQPQSQCPNGTNPGRTYRFFTGTPVVPFGFGLSYTSFQYKWNMEPKSGVVLPHYQHPHILPSLSILSQSIVSYQVLLCC
jgi:hypothetical protein